MNQNVVNNLVKVSQEHIHVIVKGAGGLQGLPGPAGAGLKIDGSVDTYAELPWHLSESDAGVAYFVQADGLLYVWTGTQWPAEGSGAQFQGPRGIQGPPGQDGERGETGEPGQPGPEGFSPVVTTEEIEDGIRINIVNKSGATSTDIDYKNLPDDIVTTSKISDGAVTSAKLAAQSVNNSKIDWANMDQLFYKAGDTITEYIASPVDGQQVVANGFLTGNKTALVVQFPVAKRLDNITSASITRCIAYGRCSGAYLDGLVGADAVTASDSITTYVHKGVNTISVCFTKNNGWGTTNNAPVSLAIIDLEIALS